MAEDAEHLAERIRVALVSAATSQRELEEAEAKVKAAQADVQSSEARVDTARLNLAYCTIVAPFAGRLGPFMVKPGAIVKTDEADLVEITKTDPIDVGLSVPEDNLGAIRKAMAAGPVRVEATPSGDSGAPAAGSLSFIDSKVDAMTGTIRLKATFANADRRLWPGQFTNVVLLLGREPGSVTIPESAIQPSQTGPSIFVVKADQTVELRQVKVRRIADGQGVIDQGVSAGETVVTGGQLRLGPGVKVEVRSASAAASPSAGG
jgi:multidrug efflux system membrane fusion protein